MTESLAELLRFFRSSAHLSQEALAERSGLSTRTVSDIETGVARTPRLITLMLLAEALGLSPADRNRLQDVGRKPATEVSTPLTAAARPVPALVGRDLDCARVGALLANDAVRLVTLVGPAGVGKTSLALRAAIDARARAGGTAIVELASLADPALVPSAVASALGVRESIDTPAREAVPAYLRDRDVLLVLDNLEHLTPSVSWIATLLAASPRLTVLATSREPLHLREERVYAVRPLAKESAVTLFVERAQMAQPDFKVTAENSAAIASIVEHLEGLPLAIELAAPRLALLGAKALAARLERRLALLGDGARDRPERHQTMHRAIAWSYDLLSQDEQRFFRRLSVLQGSGDLEAAAAIEGAEGDARSIVFRLAPLVDKNMIALAEDPDGEPRVSMLEMLREFAQERLELSGEADEVRRRHATYMINFAERAGGSLSSAAQGAWLARFELEHRNLRAALEWALRCNETELGCRLVASIWRFWWLHGYLTEGLEWVRVALDRREAAPEMVPDALYGKVLRAHVVLLSALGSFDEAYESSERAIRLQRRIKDDAGLAASLTSLGIIRQFRGELDGAGQAHQEALDIRRRIADETGVATSLSNLSSIAFSKGDLTRAAALAEESVAIYRRLGHESGLAHALTKIGLVAAAERDYGRAEQIFEECLRMQRAIGNAGSMHYSLVNLGASAHQRGAYELALERYHEALDLLDSMPNKSSLAKTLEDLAATIAAVGDPSLAARLLGAADALRITIHSPIFPSERADYENELAEVRAMLGPDAFDIQWRLGASITLERALAEARATRPGSAGARRDAR